MSRSVKLLLVLALAAAAHPAAGQWRRADTRRTQTLFGPETPIRQPVRMTRAVLKLITETDREGEQVCGGDDIEAERHLVGSALHINRDRLPDLVVQATGGCFMEAHATTFWVLTRYATRTGSGHDLLLTTRADFLQVLRTSTRGYLDIESGSATAAELRVTVWRFDGSVYRPSECTVQDLKTRRVRRTPCAPPEEI